MRKNTVFSVMMVALIGILTIAVVGNQPTKAGMYGTSEELVKSMEKLFELNDQWAMDAEPFPVWGPYWCAHLTKGKGNMVHFAKDPSKDDADIIMLVKAEPFIEKASLNVDVFPKLDKPPYGPGLTSGQ